jgi:hypothetical protein
VIGVEPGPFTLRELVWMAEGRGRDLWSHTSALLALIANVNRDPKKSRPLKPADFNPHAASLRKAPGGPVIKTKDLGILRQVFVRPPASPAPRNPPA